MTTIAIIGAGGHVFPLRLMNDFLSFPSLQDAQYVLMDPEPTALARTERLTRRLAEAHRLPVRITTETELGRALPGADFVVTCFQVGGVTAYAADIEIPRRYGVDQAVGDTLGPGGVFRGLRTMLALERICDAMADLCPDALLLNYANPMSINCLFTAERGIRTVGLCHSVQHTVDELAAIAGYAPGEWTFLSAGINHQAWILEFRHRGQDALPELREAVRAYRRGEREPRPPIDEWYAGGREGVRTAIMELTGYFPTESSHHASEYYPYFRRSPEDVRRWLPERWDYLEIGRSSDDAEQERLADEFASGRLETSEEYAARIADAIVTDTPRTVYGNVPNTGLVTNLPDAACAEVPILVDGSGVHPTVVGDLPVACAAVNLGAIGLQLCTLEAYRTRSRDRVYEAVALDRLTSSVLGLDEIRRLCDELIEAERAWLPELA